MRHKSVTRKKPKALPTVPTSTYDAFAQLLREVLSEDQSFKADYLLKTFESKLLDGNTSESAAVRRSRAIEKWLATEERNRLTNQRIYHANEEDFLFLDAGGFPVFAPEFIQWCSSSILSLLGESIPWDELSGSFSGGACTSVRRGVGMISKKYQEGKHITLDAIPHFLRLTQSVHEMPRDFELLGHNVMFTVPKSSEIDRCACKEPDLNMYCQKAVGDYFRRRLKTVGVDLNDQTLNQRLARQGSIDNSLATVDLSSASDSVTTQLVISFLPFEWSSLLLDLRSPSTEIDGSLHVNEMISSMGNAFTFELESLLFWTLARGCAYFTRTKGRISVYGDDIICPSGLHDSLNSVLEFFGFVPNVTKSFWTGPFRESCGKHWFSGVDVSPFYVKKRPTSISDWCLLLNSLRKWADDKGRTSFGICDPRYWPIWELFSEVVPRPLHGGRDTSRRDALVRPGLRCVARVVPKQHHERRIEMSYELGSYLAWLDTTKDRDSVDVTREHRFTRDGEEVLRRASPDVFVTGIPQFPQEIGE